MAELLKWQKKHIERIESMSNSELLDEALELAGGDSWDGIFTKRGEWEYSAITLHLRMRLVDWLNEGEQE